jgi:uncharacterized protein (TIGR01777 family)
MPMKIFITGGSGLLGSCLIKELISKGHAVAALARGTKNAGTLQNIGATPIEGDATKPGPWLDVVKKCDAVIHLAGANIFAKRWSPAFKEEIRKSRIESTRRIAGAISDPDAKVRILFSASAVGYYGDDFNSDVDESGKPGKDFLAQVCASWERAACISKPEVRTVYLRSGIVLSSEGGALDKVLPIFRLGLGGKLGDGKQKMSWIHRDDWVRAVLFMLEHEELKGPVNLTAPYTVTNEDYTKTIGRFLHRPTFFTVPKLALNLALGESAALILGSQHVRPKKLMDAGFVFSYPDVSSALQQILIKPNKMLR